MTTRNALFALLSAMLLAAAPAARAQQTAQCALLSDMRAIDAAVSRYAGGGGGIRAAVADALGSVRARAGVAGQAGVPGFDAQFLNDFAASRQQAMDLAARGATAATVLADQTLVGTAGRLGSLWVALDCASEEERRDANAPRRSEAEGSPTRGLAGAARAGASGQARFAALTDFGGNPWRIEGNPAIWRAIAVFLLVFAALVVVLGWMRSVHHRQAERHPCALDVVVFRGRRGMRAKLIDLSHLGAKVRMEQPPRRHSQVTLKWRGIRVEARVVWANQYFAGLSFARALGDDECSRMLKAGQAGPLFRPQPKTQVPAPQAPKSRPSQSVT